MSQIDYTQLPYKPFVKRNVVSTVMELLESEGTNDPEEFMMDFGPTHERTYYETGAWGYISPLYDMGKEAAKVGDKLGDKWGKLADKIAERVLSPFFSGETLNLVEVAEEFVAQLMEMDKEVSGEAYGELENFGAVEE